MKRAIKKLEEPTRGEKKKQEILASAAAVIAEFGYAQTMLTEIATRAKTQSGSLYYYFDSKDDLIEEVLRRGVQVTFDGAQKAVAELGSDATPLMKVEVAIRTHLSLVLDEGNYARATARLTGQIPEVMSSRINDLYQRYGSFLDKLIRAAIRSGEIDRKVDPSAYRLLIIGAMNWAPEWFRKQGRLSVDEVTDLFIRMVIDGVRTPAGNSAPRQRRS